MSVSRNQNRSGQSGGRGNKKSAVPMKRKELTPAQRAAATRAEKKAKADALEKAKAQQLAQIVNLHIAGYSLAQIGQAIGATADEVDRMLATDTARYVRSQPALRVFVRNYVSEKYTALLESVWDQAVDKTHPRQLENQDRAVRLLDSMRKLHGADAPVQTEITVDAAPEAVEKMVAALSASQGLGYDADIFDVVDAEVVEDAVEQTAAATLDAAEKVGETSGPDDDEEW